MDEALTALLLANAALAALIGNGDRLYWDTIGQGKDNPAVVMYLISGIPDYHMTGPSGLVESRVQIDARGTTRASARAVANAVESVLSGYRGTVGAIKFGGIFKDGARSRFDKTEAEAFYVVSADYRIWNGLAA